MHMKNSVNCNPSLCAGAFALVLKSNGGKFVEPYKWNSNDKRFVIVMLIQNDKIQFLRLLLRFRENEIINYYRNGTLLVVSPFGMYSFSFSIERKIESSRSTVIL